MAKKQYGSNNTFNKWVKIMQGVLDHFNLSIALADIRGIISITIIMKNCADAS